MTAHAVYAAMDPDQPATTSATVIHETIRERIGFTGLLMSDDLSMKALKGGFGERTRAALQAGCDLVLHCNGDMAEMEAVAEEAGALSEPGLARSDVALARLAEPPEALDLDSALAEFAEIMGISGEDRWG
jgi:beta-N-acetylhexosaminidase